MSLEITRMEICGIEVISPGLPNRFITASEQIARALRHAAGHAVQMHMGLNPEHRFAARFLRDRSRQRPGVIAVFGPFGSLLDDSIDRDPGYPQFNPGIYHRRLRRLRLASFSSLPSVK